MILPYISSYITPLIPQAKGSKVPRVIQDVASTVAAIIGDVLEMCLQQCAYSFEKGKQPSNADLDGKNTKQHHVLDTTAHTAIMISMLTAHERIPLRHRHVQSQEKRCEPRNLVAGFGETASLHEGYTGDSIGVTRGYRLLRGYLESRL